MNFFRRLGNRNKSAFAVRHNPLGLGALAPRIMLAALRAFPISEVIADKREPLFQIRACTFSQVFIAAHTPHRSKPHPQCEH